MVPFWGGFKVFPEGVEVIKSYKWGWPFVDIKWYTVKEDTIEFEKKNVPKSHILPLRSAKVNEKISVKVPNNYNAILNTIMGPDWRKQCHSRAWSRQNEAP